MAKSDMVYTSCYRFVMKDAPTYGHENTGRMMIDESEILQDSIKKQLSSVKKRFKRTLVMVGSWLMGIFGMDCDNAQHFG